jgi:ribosomal protein S18 acetylase RimI-like enzyme
MKEHHLSVIWEPSQQETEQIRQGLTQFGIDAIGGVPPKSLAVLMKTDHSRVIGGATGEVILGHFFLHQLWIDTPLRGKGYGSRILDKVEQTVCEIGCCEVTLDTMNPRSKAFYEQHGYRVINEIDDYIPGFNRIFYKKQLILKSPSQN